MKKFRITMFGAVALVIVLVILFRNVTGRDNPLFDQSIVTTFYAETEIGVEPVFEAGDYFSEEEYDLEKITFDYGALDVEKEGVCPVPVLYDGKKTNCTVSVIVAGGEGETPETRAGMSGDAVISETTGR